VKLSVDEKKAADAFNSFDKDNKGTVASTLIEDVLEELGENFHGAELDKIVKICGGDQIERIKFAKWYGELVSRNDDSDASIDSEEEAEREEERVKAVEAFDGLAEGGTIKEEQFAKILVNLGSTYCEEEHVRTLESIVTDGCIDKGTFVDWYVDWLFGDNEDDEYSDTEYNEKNGIAADADGDDGCDKAAAVTSGGWGNTFVSGEKKWKCEVCMCSNSEEKHKLKCPACESPRPGFEKECEAADNAGSSTNGAGISSGGFSFGAPATTAAKTTTTAAPTITFGASTTTPSDPSKFTFGAPVAAAPSPVPVPATGGFTFGSSAPTPTPSAGGGFSFGSSAPAPAPAPATNAGGGFSFGSSAQAPAPAPATNGGLSFGKLNDTPSIFGSSTSPPKLNAMTFSPSTAIGSQGLVDLQGKTSNQVKTRLKSKSIFGHSSILQHSSNLTPELEEDDDA